MVKRFSGIIIAQGAWAWGDIRIMVLNIYCDNLRCFYVTLYMPSTRLKTLYNIWFSFPCRSGGIRGDEAITNEGKPSGKPMRTIVRG